MFIELPRFHKKHANSIIKDKSCFLSYTALVKLRTKVKYSRTSIARTLMARLPWLFRTRFQVHLENPIAAVL